MDVKIILCILYSSFFSFVSSLILTKQIIKISSKKNMFQIIREDLGDLHQNKTNIPSFGGIAINISFLITFLISLIFIRYDKKVFYLIICYIFFFLVGIIDDYLKIKMKDGKGLKGKIRIALEIIIVMIFIYLLGYQNGSKWIIQMPFINTFKYVGWTYIFFIIFLLVGTSNAVNLTDGLDGLASGVMIISLLPFAFIALRNSENNISNIILMMVGSILGFLVYNFYPAKIFMGDCGSLSIGFFLGGIALLLKKELLLLFTGFIFVIETLSVILQVFSFKLFKKRIFKIAPLHHHLEKSGFSERKIVLLFYILSLFMSLMTIFMEKSQ